ncbi:uncharacterized protein LOC115632384 [Scaptodrosophila lebanonensis]|uniref:Uncharacterized protein LOC115632384 n=1 Tax=Drosophila lebanonensis TaxID=7225 RepID=A0A6J2UD60_DROLE|nr:uncharacterized protein LOC115632384 [Scaptodrosophila lebanonensis]
MAAAKKINAALRDPTAPGYNVARDPTLVRNRIFVGNLPSCTREELESICHPYGKVIGSLVQTHFGFVQFESEEVADKCAAALNKSIFKSNALTVRNASVKAWPSQSGKKGLQNTIAGIGVGANTVGPTVNTVQCVPAPSEVVPINDCEIIVVNRENTKYAEFVEERLTQAGMLVDVLYPNEDVMLGKVLANISARGCLYAVLVTPQHQKLNSITVNILYGVPAEHRNMPVEDAITLIATDFRLKKHRDNAMPKNAPPPPPQPPQKIIQHQYRHPEPMQQLLNLLADNRALRSFEYETLIKYLQERHVKQLAVEHGEAKLQEIDPEIELQKKILSIMNKPSVTDINYELMYPTFEAAREDTRLIQLLEDPRVFAALESIYDSDLTDTIAKYL